MSRQALVCGPGRCSASRPSTWDSTPKLLAGVIDIARAQGVRLLAGDVLATNQPMLDLVMRLGFATRRGSDPQVVRVEMRL